MRTDHRDAALAFLLQAQAPDGAWRDFDLEPGASDSWLTAFVALVLVRTSSGAETSHHDARARSVQRAIEFLMGAARFDARGMPSWGYNGRVPADADSTAHVALLLHAVGHGAAPAAGRSVLSFVQETGGIGTFRRSNPQDSWGHAHADVTAVAVRTLRLSNVDEAVISAALAYLRGAVKGGGLWRSYWWTTDWFATLAVLRAFRALRVPFDHTMTRDALEDVEIPDAAFDAALLLSLLRLTDGDVEHQSAIVAALHRAQLRDGSWESVPRLRVTDSRSDAASDVTSGVMGRDQHRLYTTASVLHAISRAPAP